MNRSLIIVLGALALGGALFGGSYFAGRRICRICMEQPAGPAGDLAWLRKEYHLDDPAMVQIRKLHDDYVARCAVMCRMYDAEKQELETVLGNSTNLNPAARQKLSELASCRAQCQAQMLQYFVDVSRAMPPAEGRRYLADMQRLTLNLTGPNPPMSESMGHEHHSP